MANLILVPAFADADGYALRFDGNSDWVQLPQTATVFASGWETSKSVSLWVRPDGAQTACTVSPDLFAVSACPSIFGDFPTFWGMTIGYLAGPAQNRIWVWNYDGVAPTPYDYIGIEYTPGVWVHIALVHSGGTLSAYKNGVLVGSVPTGNSFVLDGSALNLGGVIQNDSNYWLFKGDIDEVSLWNGALTAGDISANLYSTAPTATTATLAAFYRMTEGGTATTLLDDSGNGRTGTLKDGKLPSFLPDGTYPLWVDSTAFGPSVTINQASGQADPANTAPVNFTVVFSRAVTGFETGDVDLSASTAPGTLTAAVTGSGTTYNVAVSGMTGTGTVVAAIPPAVAQDASGYDNGPSISTDNSVTFDASGPTVTIDQAAAQADPTNTGPVNFTVVFDETVTDFANVDVDLSASTAPGALSAAVTGSGTTYNVAVSGMSGSGLVIASIPAGVVHDSFGNPNTASTSTDNQVTYDVTRPTVTINQASGQADPTNDSPVNFTVVFNESVTGFTGADVVLSASTTPGTLSADVTGSGTTYNVAVSGMTSNGTVIASIPAGAATDAAGNTNTASTSSDNQVTYDITGPTVTLNQASGQADPTNAAPVNFTVVFSDVVDDFTGADVILSASTTSGMLSANVTGSGTTYNVAVSGMTGSGLVIASIPAGAAHDSLGNPNTASTSSDNQVTYDITGPAVTINQAASQADPTSASPINFTVVFNESVTGFTGTDVNLSASTTPGTLSAVVTGGGTTYNVAVSGMSDTGTVIASIPAGVAQDALGNLNAASTSSDNQVTYNVTGPTVTINQAAGQADPTNTSPVNFTVVFSAAVTGFSGTDVILSASTAPGTLSATVTGSGATYNVAVLGMTGSGDVIASIPAGVANDTLGNPNMASTSSDNQVTYDITGPGVTIDQAASQADPTNASTINFTVVFNEPVSGFTGVDVNLSSSTATGTLSALVTGSGATYNVAVSGMTGSGLVIATIPAGAAQDALGNLSSASTSSDNQVTYDVTAPTVTINQAASQFDPAPAAPIIFQVVFSEAVTGFTGADVSLASSTAPGTLIATVTGSGASYTVSVSGMTGSGTVIASIPAGVAQDAAGNSNAVSTSSDNTVSFIYSPNRIYLPLVNR